MAATLRSGQSCLMIPATRDRVGHQMHISCAPPKWPKTACEARLDSFVRIGFCSVDCRDPGIYRRLQTRGETDADETQQR